jgi:hypothetical protein
LAGLCLKSQIKNMRLEILHTGYFKRQWYFLQRFGGQDCLPSVSLCYIRIPYLPTTTIVVSI